jgi:hypothetical protein
MTRSRAVLIAAVAGPAVLCALIGLTHPMDLNAGTAEHWRDMHILLIPVFPLIGLAPWLVARQVNPRLGYLAAILGYGFATFYTSLDLLAGVAGGALVMSGNTDATGPVFAVARALARVGAWSLVLGAVVASAAAFRRSRIAAVPGAVLAIGGAALVYRGHIYVPVGTLAMLLLAVGFAWLAVVVTRRGEARATPSGPLRRRRV